MSATAKIILRSDYDYNAESERKSIALRITIDRKTRKYSLHIFTLPANWDFGKGMVKKSDPWYNNHNKIILTSLNKANTIITNSVINNKTLSFVEFERQYFDNNVKNDSFYSFAQEVLENAKGIFSEDTIKTQGTQITKLKRFKQELNLSDVTLDFLHEYRKYMIVTLENNENTCNKSMSWIRAIINKAIIKNLIKDNPFKHFHIKAIVGNRNFLTIEELKKLENLQNTDLHKNKLNVLRYFLFACYTGLRYTDLKNLKYSDINDNMIKMIMHKTKDHITIPLPNQAKTLINTGFDNQKIFNVYSNQKSNQYLREIIKTTDINKHLSFHCARHTFATIGISTLGIPIEVVSKLLGHKDLKTTQIYAKILDTVKIREMNKWNSLNL